MTAKSCTRSMALGMVLWIFMSTAGAAAQTLWDDPAFALYRQGVEAFNRKEYDRAEHLTRDAITQYPQHLLAHYLLGQAALAQSNWFNLGVVRLRLEDQQGALTAFEQAARDPQLKDQATREVAKIHAHQKALEPRSRGIHQPGQR